MDLPYIYVLVINDLLFFCVLCLLLLKPSNSGGQILKACRGEYSAFLFLKERSFAYSIDHTSKDVLLPRVWLQGSALSLMLHFNLKIIKNPFCKHIAATLSSCSESPATFSWWNPTTCAASGNQSGLILIYLKFQGHTEIANGRFALFSPV